MFEICRCGSTEFYMRQQVSGFCDFFVDMFGKPVEDNSSMYDNLHHRDTRKHYRCSDCDRIAKKAE